MMKSTIPHLKLISNKEDLTHSNEKYIVSSFIDFWVVGGFSVVLYGLLLFTYKTGLSQFAPFSRNLNQMATAFALMGLVINSPHFFWSFKLAYTQNSIFLLRNWGKLLFFPSFLLSLFALAYFGWAIPVQGTEPAALIDGVFSKLGLATRIGQYKNLGTLIIGLLLVTQFSLLGWHYVKQIYGIMMAYANYAKYPLTPMQRNYIRYALFGIWWNYWFNVNAGFKQFAFGDIPYFNLNFPTSLPTLAFAYLIISLVVVIVRVFIPIYKEHQRLPPTNVLISFVAIYLWFVPFLYLQTPGFFEGIVPFCHSMQYLLFIYKVERSSLIEKAKFKSLNIAILIFTMILGTFLIGEVTPALLDRHFAPVDGPSTGFFVVCGYLFINLHHYFVDSVIWKQTNPEVFKLFNR